MCLLILLLRIDPESPIVVAGNRDERRDRASAPPGLFVGQSHRILSPRDRVAGGTWLGVSEGGMFAGLTNLVGVPMPESATSRGVLPHRALDQSDLASACAEIEGLVAREPFGGFQLLLSDGDRAVLFSHAGDGLERREFDGGAIVISNEHREGELLLPGLEDACEPGLPTDARLEALRELLLDAGASSGHRVLKQGGDYGTVSSSLIAIPEDVRGLVWRFANGQPDQVPYRDYGNLSRRLFDEG